LEHEKARVTHTKTLEEEDQKKRKENLKVLARIAFKEWKVKKADEARETKDIRKKVKAAIRLEMDEKFKVREMMVSEMQRRRGNNLNCAATNPAWASGPEL